MASTVWLFSEDHPNAQFFTASGCDDGDGCATHGVNIRYNSFKGLGLKGRVPFIAMLAVVLAFVVITIKPALALLSIALALRGLWPRFWVKNRSNSAENPQK